MLFYKKNSFTVGAHRHNFAKNRTKQNSFFKIVNVKNKIQDF